MFPTYEPSSLIHTIIALVFYIIMAGFAVYSALAIYTLIRFGKAKFMAFGIAVIYIIISISLYAEAVSNLNRLKF